MALNNTQISLADVDDEYRAFIEIHLQIVGILVLESFRTYNYLESILKYFEQYCQLVGGFKNFFG